MVCSYKKCVPYLFILLLAFTCKTVVLNMLICHIYTLLYIFHFSQPHQGNDCAVFISMIYVSSTDLTDKDINLLLKCKQENKEMLLCAV